MKTGCRKCLGNFLKPSLHKIVINVVMIPVRISNINLTATEFAKAAFWVKRYTRL